MLKYLGQRVLLATLCLPMLTFAQENNAVPPIPQPRLDNPDKVVLGKQLYNDVTLSKDFSLSCASCHSLSKGGADGLPRFIGMYHKEGMYNTPTVYNASLAFRQFWDGRAKTLDQVLDDHVKDELILANNWDEIVNRIKDESNLSPSFKKLYKDKVTAHNVKDAIIAYLGTLLTPDSPFDQYLKGDKNALSEDQKKGYQLFLQYGCVTCHEGPDMGGNLYQKMGIYKNYFTDRHSITEADLGRFNVTHQEEDKFVFKVPTLRNVALTAPYLHDGSVKTLEEMVQIMGVYEVGQTIPDFEIPLIVKFLESLTGVLPTDKSSQVPTPSNKSQ